MEVQSLCQFDNILVVIRDIVVVSISEKIISTT